MPNLRDFHSSMTDELHALKDRIRHLVTHWQTDGEWKEAALRTILRRHLPGNVVVGRGFIVGRAFSTTQIDLLILNPMKPTLFRDGDLAVVTPDVAGAVISVKTELIGPKAWHDAALELAKIAAKCREVANNTPWLGLFSYEGDEGQGHHALEAVCDVFQETKVAINCVTCGRDAFIRYWAVAEKERGDSEADAHRAYWRLYHLKNLAPAYMVGNIVDAMCDVDKTETDYTWFAYMEGKRPHMVAEQRQEECGGNPVSEKLSQKQRPGFPLRRKPK